MGTPSSHGCVRMYDADCTYIYDQIPYDTTVVVF
ncbi:MAG: L,D-transpeptidase family protein [Oscillospiraceae bacterium]